LAVDGAFWFNGDVIHADGTIISLVGGEEVTLFTGVWELNIGALVANTVEDVDAAGAGTEFKIAGANVRFDGLEFYKPEGVAAIDGQIRLQGVVTLPETLGSYEVAITGDDYIGVSRKGIEVSGFTIEATRATTYCSAVAATTSLMAARATTCWMAAPDRISWTAARATMF
jgi:hypothetical protein